MLLKRVDVFVDFFGKGKFDGVSIDGDQSEQLIKVLDSVVIMLEGGSEPDLQVSLPTHLFAKLIFTDTYF